MALHKADSTGRLARPWRMLRLSMVLRVALVAVPAISHGSNEILQHHGPDIKPPDPLRGNQFSRMKQVDNLGRADGLERT